MQDKITVGIIGLGLIGGSIAKGLLNYSEKYSIIGFVRDTSLYVDMPCTIYDDYQALAQCKIIIIATPIHTIEQIMADIQPYLMTESIITDVASIKESIHLHAQRIIRSDCIFIGGHPMAGTEHSGWNAAHQDLFQGKRWVLLEHNSCLESLIRDLGSKIIICNPQEHDLAVAYISHMPLLLSMSLQSMVDNIEDQYLRELAHSLASSGYESMTRLSRGNTILNHDLLSANAGHIQLLIEEYQSHMNKIFQQNNS